MYCSKCGAENSDDSIFCNKCGAALQDNGDEKVVKKSKPWEIWKRKEDMVALTGCAMMFFSIFMPYVSITIFGVKKDMALLEGDGKLLLVLLLAATVMLFLRYRAVFDISAGLAVALSLYEIFNTNHVIQNTKFGEYDLSGIYSKGMGFYLLILGMFVLIAGFIMQTIVDKNKRNGEKSKERLCAKETESIAKTDEIDRPKKSKKIAIISILILVVLLGTVLGVFQYTKQKKAEEAERIKQESLEAGKNVIYKYLEEIKKGNTAEAENYKKQGAVGIDSFVQKIMMSEITDTFEEYFIEPYGSINELSEESKTRYTDFKSRMPYIGFREYQIRGAEYNNGTVLVSVDVENLKTVDDLAPAIIEIMDTYSQMVGDYAEQHRTEVAKVYSEKGVYGSYFYVVDKLLPDILELFSEKLEKTAGQCGTEKNSFVFHVEREGDEWKITSAEAEEKVSSSKDSPEYYLADNIHISFLTALMDPEVMTAPDYADNVSVLQKGLEITTHKGPYRKGEDSICWAAADILGVSDFKELSGQIAMPGATGKIYVTLLGSNKVRVEIDGTDIVIE